MELARNRGKIDSFSPGGYGADNLKPIARAELDGFMWWSTDIKRKRQVQWVAAQAAYAWVDVDDVGTRVRAASVGANVTLTAPGTTLDGVTLAVGDRVLLKDQSTGSQNGPWVFQGSTVSMTRPLDFASGAALLGMGAHSFAVSEGTTNANTEWECTTTGTITVDTTALAYKRFDGSWDEWETLYHASALLAASAAGGTWLLRYDGGTPLISTAAQNAGTAMFYLDPAQYAVTGKTIQVRLAASVVTNSTAPGITFTFGLYPVSSVAAFVPTLGTVSTSVAIATPALNTRTPGWGAALTMPAAGEYVLGCATSGANAAATQILNCALQVRAI